MLGTVLGTGDRVRSKAGKIPDLVRGRQRVKQVCR